LNRFSKVIAPDALGLVDEHVPIPQASPQLGPSDLKLLPQLLLFGVKYSLRHPRWMARAVVRRTGNVLTAMMSHIQTKTRTARQLLQAD
jgi:hypothetical protein